MSSSASKPRLRIDWATLDAARFAVEHWHYSGSLPMPPMIKLGAWEDERFIGVVIFSRGASPHLLKPYGLAQTEGCELTRVALTTHATPVSRVLAIAMRFLKSKEPTLRLIVSFADQSEGHHGGIYQAGGWLYLGTTAHKTDFLGPDGQRYLNRQVSASGVLTQFGKSTRVYRRDQCTPIPMLPKHRYLMPLDEAMRAQVAPLAQQYPKRLPRAKEQDAEHPSALDGATPIRTLQNNAV